MPTMQIFKDGIEIESREFRFQFLILASPVDKQQLFWEADGSHDADGSLIQVWIIGLSCSEPSSKGWSFYIPLIGPPWQLSLDGVAQEERVYSELDLTGKEIELQYRDYRFACSFPLHESK
jgi:hypothetical protein